MPSGMSQACIPMQECLWGRLAGRTDLLLKFLHTWMGSELVVTSQERDAGVVKDSSVKTHNQCTAHVKKVKKVEGNRG